mmetsp:Transcript_63085/g.150361  ORF Transcript_63085/g.150361 Transcript_63085/m.150361 type:complete len:226 (-) Transcript_63085:188-865(-)
MYAPSTLRGASLTFFSRMTAPVSGLKVTLLHPPTSKSITAMLRLSGFDSTSTSTYTPCLDFSSRISVQSRHRKYATSSGRSTVVISGPANGAQNIGAPLRNRTYRAFQSTRSTLASLAFLKPLVTFVSAARRVLLQAIPAYNGCSNMPSLSSSRPLKAFAPSARHGPMCARFSDFKSLQVASAAHSDAGSKSNAITTYGPSESSERNDRCHVLPTTGPVRLSLSA